MFGILGGIYMDYKKEIIEMIEKCTNNHWIEVIYVFVKKLIGQCKKRQGFAHYPCLFFYGNFQCPWIFHTDFQCIQALRLLSLAQRILCQYIQGILRQFIILYTFNYFLTVTVFITAYFHFLNIEQQNSSKDYNGSRQYQNNQGICMMFFLFIF